MYDLPKNFFVSRAFRLLVGRVLRVLWRFTAFVVGRLRELESFRLSANGDL
jgi:hypothetical protein